MRHCQNSLATPEIVSKLKHGIFSLESVLRKIFDLIAEITFCPDGTETPDEWEYLAVGLDM